MVSYKRLIILPPDMVHMMRTGAVRLIQRDLTRLVLIWVTKEYHNI